MPPFQDLKWTQGSDNMGGLVGGIFYCPVEDIDATQLPTIAADGVTLVGAFVPVATKGFIEIYHTKGTGKIDDSTVGERDGRSAENMMEFFFPGSKKEVEAFKRLARNTPCVVIGKDTDGNLRVVGVAVIGNNVVLDLPAYLEAANGTTGAQTADRRGTTFQFKAESPDAPLFYDDAIPLLP